ncbi:hypothetical protein, partial [Duncaniella muris]|uniref:hypothetical protein n=1 Tax=Duncaniella muris TaxID=2094150 RepID=UPI00271524CA
QLPARFFYIPSSAITLLRDIPTPQQSSPQSPTNRNPPALRHPPFGLAALAKIVGFRYILL